jgi:amidohydrolase
MKIINAIAANVSAIVDIRRDIHAHPELGFEEIRTSDTIANKLNDWGIQVHRGLAKTGVVGIIKNGESDRAIGLRADMDALPIQEANQFTHASQYPGKMHACGHDGHVAMLLSAAQYLAESRNFDGTVYLIFQPAEEGGGGARVMIDDGLFDKFPMEAVFGMHNYPGLDVGKFAISAGPVMASSNEFKIVVFGRGGHAAMPQETIDPVPIICQIVTALQTIISRNKSPADTVVLSVTMINAGESANAIPDTGFIQGTVRTFSVRALDMIEKRMRDIAEYICVAHGAKCDFAFKRNYPPVVNSPKEAEFCRQTLCDIIDHGNLVAQEQIMGAEDFSYMLQIKPGAYCFIGNGGGTHRTIGHGLGQCSIHSSSYDFNDELIALGATYWVRLTEAWFRKAALAAF